MPKPGEVIISWFDIDRARGRDIYKAIYTHVRGAHDTAIATNGKQMWVKLGNTTYRLTIEKVEN